jgi:hypothetical protein
LVPTCEKYFLKNLQNQANQADKIRKFQVEFWQIPSTVLRESFGNLAGFPRELPKDSRRTSQKIWNQCSIDA